MPKANKLFPFLFAPWKRDAGHGQGILVYKRNLLQINLNPQKFNPYNIFAYITIRRKPKQKRWFYLIQVSKTLAGKTPRKDFTNAKSSYIKHGFSFSRNKTIQIIETALLSLLPNARLLDKKQLQKLSNFL